MKHDNNKSQAFTIVEVNEETGETTLIIRKGILGPLANQLKQCPTQRKSFSIIRKLGTILGECGDKQYSKSEIKDDG